MGKLIKLTHIAFHIAASLYLLLGVFLVLLASKIIQLPGDQSSMNSENSFMLGFMGVFCFALAAICELVVNGLHRERFWAWVAGLILSSVFVCSIFLPLGVMGLIGLLEEPTRKRFSA